jgi:beta-lactamase regulating signal transducer with metallopeptidase domain
MAELSVGIVNAGWTLAWQVAVVAAVVWALTSLFARKRPHPAAALWLLVMIKALTPPVWTTSHNVWSLTSFWTPSATRNDQVPAADRPREIVEDAVVASEVAPASNGMAPVESVISTPTHSISPERSTAEPVTAASTSEGRPKWTVIVLGVWLIGVLLFCLMIAFRTWRLQVVLARADRCLPLEERLARLQPWVSRRSVEVLLCDAVGPAACGILRPRILLSRSLVESLPADQLDAVLTHELTHLKRRDIPLGWLQVFVQVVWWFHPAVWFANRRLTQVVEDCCDLETLHRLQCRATDYARCLLAVVEHHAARPSQSLPVGIRAFEATRMRVQRVIEVERHRTPRVWLSRAVLAIGLIVVLPGAAAPVVSDEATPMIAATTKQEPLEIKARPVVTQLLSPDGLHIAYGQIAVGPDGDQKVRIIVGNADGSDRKALPVDSENVDEIQWYGNDKIAYVLAHGENGYRLMNLEGQPAGELRMPGGCDSFFHQCLSPDGKKIVFCGNYFDTDERFENDNVRRKYLRDHPDIKQQHGLFVADLEAQTVRQLLNETVANRPAWSADSKFLACGIGHYVKDYPLVIANVETGDVQRPDVKGVAPAWAPDGLRLAMTTDVVKGGSWFGGMPLDGALAVWDVAAQKVTKISGPGTNESVKEPPSWNYSGSHTPVWSPDGLWVAYTASAYSKGSGKTNASREEIRIVKMTGDGERKVLDHRAEKLAWSPDGKQLLWVHRGQFGVVTVDAPGLTGETPATPTGRYCVTGKIVDESGKPLEGVAVRVARGMGTLFSTDPVLTDAQGRYAIHFGPGMFSSEGPNLQAASVYASKPGYAEVNLCRGGNLGMAEYRPKDQSEKDWGFVGIVYPDHLYELDFRMEPASNIDVTVVDRDGKPLAGYAVDLDGDVLPPSSSVFASSKTDDRGRVRFTDVPRQAFWFSIGRRNEYRTDPIKFDQAGKYQVQLKYDDIGGMLTAVSTSGR